MKWGIVGAGVATVVSNVFSWIALAYLCKVTFNVFPKAEHLVKPLISSLIMFCAISQFKLSNLAEGISAVLLGAVIYFAVLFAIKGLTREDFNYLGLILRED